MANLALNHNLEKRHFEKWGNRPLKRQKLGYSGTTEFRTGWVPWERESLLSVVAESINQTSMLKTTGRCLTQQRMKIRVAYFQRSACPWSAVHCNVIIDQQTIWRLFFIFLMTGVDVTDSPGDCKKLCHALGLEVSKRVKRKTYTKR
jgi:hypothetical protein